MATTVEKPHYWFTAAIPVASIPFSMANAASTEKGAEMEGDIDAYSSGRKKVLEV